MSVTPSTRSSPEPQGARLDNLDLASVSRLFEASLSGADDGEIFFETRQSESLDFDDGRLKASTYNADQGFGLRIVAGETVGFANSAELCLEAIGRAAEAASIAKSGKAVSMNLSDAPTRTNHQFYEDLDPVLEMDFASKIRLLQDIDAFARAQGEDVVQVAVGLVGERRGLTILRAQGALYHDTRPLVRLRISISVERNGRRESAQSGGGGRYSILKLANPEFWHGEVVEALRHARINLEARPAPSGEMPVVLGPGWPGVLLHEAVGHGLEGDFNRKGTSAFSGKIGQQVAAKGVTILDDGTIDAARGSINFDDEGTATNATTLIEDGILVGYMHDRLSARHFGVAPTGNGRRQSFAHQPYPRMTNTFMKAGTDRVEDMIASTNRGLYAVNFGGGQVDITNGKFVFQCTEAYLIEDGKVTTPVKGASLIGDGPEAMRQIEAIGNDLRFDKGVGICGKMGQSIPVGIGQPSLKINGLTVGGTQ